MKKFKLNFFALAILFAPLFFFSCDKIDKLTTVKVDLGEVPFTIPIELDADKTSLQMKRTSADLVSFSGKSAPINLESDMFAKLNEYDFGSVEIGRASCRERV